MAERNKNGQFKKGCKFIGDKKTQFVKGHKFIGGSMKGKHWKMSDEDRKKRSEDIKKQWRDGKRKVGKFALKGEKHHNWKGGKVGYCGLHKWVARELGKANHCGECGLDKVPEGRKHMFEWANISKKYKRDLTDWKQLCIPCHIEFDKETRKRKSNK